MKLFFVLAAFASAVAMASNAKPVEFIETASLDKLGDEMISEIAYHELPETLQRDVSQCFHALVMVHHAAPLHAHHLCLCFADKATNKEELGVNAKSIGKCFKDNENEPEQAFQSCFDAICPNHANEIRAALQGSEVIPSINGEISIQGPQRHVGVAIGAASALVVLTVAGFLARRAATSYWQQSRFDQMEAEHLEALQ
mmetsp:Transcript_70995/g.151921  ORF Transcript_70995/g.151921 Transcript_70995/m.151921 type:complete len:199 (-) Transcript_70995:61-657(-)